MVSQVEGMNSCRGWPLGLRNMNRRLRLMEAYHMAPSDSNSFPSASFSSLSSSDLDTESTRSFFQDRSVVTLGRLIGVRPGNRDAYFASESIRCQESARNSTVGASKERSSEEALCDGVLCIPLIMSIFVKTSPSREDHSEG